MAGSTDCPPSLNATLTTLDEFPPAVVLSDALEVVEMLDEVSDEDVEVESEVEDKEVGDVETDEEEDEAREVEEAVEIADDEEEGVVVVVVELLGDEDVESAYAATAAITITTITTATIIPRPIAPRLAVGTYKSSVARLMAI